MLIKSLKLSNIRSYENAEILFPEGSVLLSGDIGAGKSTILIAIEFAIFGAKKGELPAYTLLRHGKKEGFVELKALIENREVIIKRTLKKVGNDIRQDAGYIIVNGSKKEATSEEIRAIVLEMLGYPKELIKKGKDLIYRYTVYTPQEEMKQILYESKDVRLDTLRKVFGIDKYKRIKENTKIIISQLREKKKLLEGFSMDLDYKLKELDERKKESIEAQKRIEGITPKLSEVKMLLEGKKQVLAGIEKEISYLNELKKELSSAESVITVRIEQNNKLNEDIRKIESQIIDLEAELKGKNIEQQDFDAQIIQKEKELSALDIEYRQCVKKIKELEVRIEQSSEAIKKITSIDLCPLCEQKVGVSHKEHVKSSEGKKHDECVSQIKEHSEKEKAIERKKISLKAEIDSALKSKHHEDVLKLKFKNLEDRKKQKEEKLALKEKIKKEIGSLNSKKSEASLKISQFSDIEAKFANAKKEHESLLPQERFLESEKRSIEKEKEMLLRFSLVLEKEAAEKKKAKEKLAYVNRMVAWLDDFFIGLMSNMEKHVMASIHSQFNELLQNWFDVLIEDETINIRVDEEFTPIVEQNGYETYIENLSGGEKTSVALSYRLALNKVVNDVISTIKTKDIIILDEPTDGFSSEQLDRMRDILKELNMNQVIIVSHEGKIESFVQNVIKIEKREHLSVVN